MGRKRGRGRGGRSRGGGRSDQSNGNERKKVESFDSDDMEDDIDKFHSSQDFIPLEDKVSEDEDSDDPVMDLKAGASDEEFSEPDDDEELTGIAAKIAKQAKIMRRKTGVVDDDEEDDEKESESVGWGKKKSQYHGHDEILSSDEEEPAEEEAEARRLQQKISEGLRPEDFDQADDEAESGEEEEEETLEKKVQKEESFKKDSDRSTVPVEKVQKDFDALSKDEQMQVVMSNAPELVGLLTELRQSLDTLQNKIEPALDKSNADCVIGYLIKLCNERREKLLGAEGRSVCDHPVIARLVEIRTLLEKIRPFDEKLQEKIELVLEYDVATEQQPVEREKMDLDDVRNIEELRSEKEKEEEVANSGDKKEEFIGEESREMLRQMERLTSIAQQEKKDERVPVISKGHKKLNKRLASLMDDLGDDVDEEERENDGKKVKKLTQVIAEAGRRQKKPKIISGDVDLPKKEELGERRRKHEMQKPLFNGDDEEEEEKEFEDEDEEFKKEAKKKVKAEKKNGKKEKIVQVKEKEKENDDVDVDGSLSKGKRHISYEMEKNRGLTPYRKKTGKNPRKKYQMKHEKAVIRRKGQVRSMRSEMGSYGGEVSGIRTNISRSIRFDS